MQKDVALISLANVLHRARYSNEAAIVVHAALDVSKELNVNHFTLGNIYAVSFSLQCTFLALFIFLAVLTYIESPETSNMDNVSVCIIFLRK